MDLEKVVLRVLFHGEKRFWNEVACLISVTFDKILKELTSYQGNSASDRKFQIHPSLKSTMSHTHQREKLISCFCIGLKGSPHAAGDYI